MKKMMMLEGIRVIEQGTFITGPCAGMMLADLGADVIKIESPGEGDPYRSFRGGHYSPHFQAYNRNKRSVALNLKQPSDLELFDRLVAKADVFIQNFRPGTADRLGAGYERLRTINPGLIYCSISGFGATGPYASRPSYDSVAQALSGFLSVVIDPERPRFLGPALADALTGIYAAYGILGALVSRKDSGCGHLVEVSMLEAMMHFAVEPITSYFGLAVVPTSSDRPRLAQAYILKAKDRQFLAVHLSSLEKFWLNLTAALGAELLREDPRFAHRLSRIDNYEALNTELNRYFAQRPIAEWIPLFQERDVPFAPVNSIEDATNNPQVEHLGLIVEAKGAGEGASKTVRPAVTFDGVRSASVSAAPIVDEHGDGIRAALASGQGWPEETTAAV
jgi:crotonobetainyl-CoA:carnitine CoA-transferase CaiB-like acyl-CoA transferase